MLTKGLSRSWKGVMQDRMNSTAVIWYVCCWRREERRSCARVLGNNENPRPSWYASFRSHMLTSTATVFGPFPPQSPFLEFSELRTMGAPVCHGQACLSCTKCHDTFRRGYRPSRPKIQWPTPGHHEEYENCRIVHLNGWMLAEGWVCRGA